MRPRGTVLDAGAEPVRYRGFPPGQGPNYPGAMMDYVIALVPPIGLLIILVVIVRAFLGADRSERAAERKFREEHPDLDLAPLPPGRSSVAGALAAEEARHDRNGAATASEEPDESR